MNLIHSPYVVFILIKNIPFSIQKYYFTCSPRQIYTFDNQSKRFECVNFIFCDFSDHYNFNILSLELTAIFPHILIIYASYSLTLYLVWLLGLLQGKHYCAKKLKSTHTFTVMLYPAISIYLKAEVTVLVKIYQPYTFIMVTSLHRQQSITR